MQLSQPGPLWYTATLMSVRPSGGSTVIGSFQVIDAAGNYHNGLAVDGATVQPLLEVEIDVAALPANIRSVIQSALQNLLIQEFGGNVGTMISAVMAQGASFT